MLDSIVKIENQYMIVSTNNELQKYILMATEQQYLLQI